MHCNLGRIEFGETRGDIGQLGLFGRREYVIDLHVVQVLTRIVEVICAENHHLDWNRRWAGVLHEKIGAEESNETGGDEKFHWMDCFARIDEITV